MFVHKHTHTHQIALPLSLFRLQCRKWLLCLSAFCLYVSCGLKLDNHNHWMSTGNSRNWITRVSCNSSQKLRLNCFFVSMPTFIYFCAHVCTWHTSLLWPLQFLSQTPHYLQDLDLWSQVVLHAPFGESFSTIHIWCSGHKFETNSSINGRSISKNVQQQNYHVMKIILPHDIRF